MNNLEQTNGENSPKTAGEQLAQKLVRRTENTAMASDEAFKEQAWKFAESYKSFMAACKTERETVDYIADMAKQHGYIAFADAKSPKPGDKLFYNNRGKAAIMTTIGTRPLTDGVRIVASHIDSPRIDLKPNPLYEEGQIAMFKTHYYGGIKKYQWTTIPLSLHGVIVKKDGETLKIDIGEQDDAPVFTITDLLPHLATEQMKRSLKEGVKGEELNVLVGCVPYPDKKVTEAVKLNILKLLNEKYEIIENDFISSELCLVPQFAPRDVGLDRSMIGAYGHDDKSCAYPSLMAELECAAPEYTTVTVFADKEETGSDGNTGLHSRFLEYYVEDLAKLFGLSGREVFAKSTSLSADVNAAFDPTYGDTLEKRNCSYINRGVCVTQYTGAGGKSGTSQASAEFMAQIRSLFDSQNVAWQTGELGKVDLGGGGTVAKYVAALNVDVVDIGVPVLSMHSPFEIISKMDLYSTYQAFCAYLGK